MQLQTKGLLGPKRIETFAVLLSSFCVYELEGERSEAGVWWLCWLFLLISWVVRLGRYLHSAGRGLVSTVGEERLEGQRLGVELVLASRRGEVKGRHERERFLERHKRY